MQWSATVSVRRFAGSQDRDLTTATQSAPGSSGTTRLGGAGLTDPVGVALLKAIRSAKIQIRERRGRARVLPKPPPELTAQLHDRRSELRSLLPGLSDECGQWARRRIVACWPPHPHFCPVCCPRIADQFEAANRWPPVPWEDPGPASQRHSSRAVSGASPNQLLA